MAAGGIESADFSETGYSFTLSLISGKYKPVILYCLMEYEPVRFNQMQRYLREVADKTLSQNLKELESDGLISRKMYPQVPPKVEYTLTPLGKSLMKILDQLCVWGLKHRPKAGGGHQKEGGLIMRWLLLDAFIVIGSVGLQLVGCAYYVVRRW